MALDCFVVFELSNATWMFSSPHNDINVVVASSLHFFPRDAMMPRMFANEHANDTAGITDTFLWQWHADPGFRRVETTFLSCDNGQIL